VGKFQIFLIRFLSVTHRSSFAASEGLTEIRIYFSLQLAVPFVDENGKKITVLLLIGTEIAILHIPFLQAGRAASLPGRRRLWTNTGEQPYCLSRGKVDFLINYFPKFPRFV